jgi:hypothetical protein
VPFRSRLASAESYTAHMRIVTKMPTSPRPKAT